MTAPRAVAGSPWVTWMIAAAGSAALLVRPNVATSLVTVGLVGLAGMLASDASLRVRPHAVPWTVVVLAGCVVFYAGRELGPPVGVRVNALGVFAITFTAVAEEAFFRRFLYGRLLRYGVVPAIAFTSALFALIHVPAYGMVVLPIDLAAGALLGWQRYATGTWTAPAVTHLIANLMMMG